MEFLTSKRLWMLVISASLVSLFLIRSWLRTVRLAFSLPGPPALPLLGNIFMIKDGRGFVKIGDTLFKNYGSLLRGCITVLPVITVLDPKDIQCILSNAKFTDKNFLYSFMSTFLGAGLITDKGNKWKLHRKYIQPYFHISVLEMFLQTFSEGASALIEQLPCETEIKITYFVNRCVLEILHAAILGIPLKEETVKEQSPFRKGCLVITDRILHPWLLLDWVYKFTQTAKHECKQQLTLQTFTKKILEQRKAINKRGEALQRCLLDMFLEISENNPDFTDDDVINETCAFMLAGQDSVGAAISFTLYYLAKHEDFQKKLVMELDQVFKQPASVTMEVLNNMKYLEQCIKETMRLCPSVPLIARELREDVRIGNYVLPVGLNVFISPYVTHRLPHYYPDPEVFDPNRFSTSNTENRHPYAYLPFSAGPRNCIGYKFAMLEMKTIIATILRRYRISLAPGYELELKYRVTLRAKGGIPLILHLR